MVRTKKGRLKSRPKEVQRECVVFRALPPGFDLGTDLDVAIDAFTTSGFRLIAEERCRVGTNHRARPVTGACAPLLRNGNFLQVGFFVVVGVVHILVTEFQL